MVGSLKYKVSYTSLAITNITSDSPVQRKLRSSAQNARKITTSPSAPQARVTHPPDSLRNSSTANSTTGTKNMGCSGCIKSDGNNTGGLASLEFLRTWNASGTEQAKSAIAQMELLTLEERDP